MSEQIPPVSKAPKGAFTSPFAFDLYRELAAGSGNLSFSPFGIASALVLVQAGAAGRTRHAIEDVLRCSGAGDHLIGEVGALTRDLREPDAKHHTLFSVASALWKQVGYAIHSGYRETLQAELGAETRELDFAEQPSEAVRAVNAWVAAETADRIPRILSEGAVDSLTRGVVANAIYLRAPWARKFTEWQTRPRPFHLSDGTRIDVPTMHVEEAFGYLRDEGLQALQLRYRNRRFSMLVLLPDLGRLERVERELDATRLRRLVEDMDGRMLDLFLPRFRIESSLLLRSVLEGLGMQRAFGAEADFTRMSSEPGFRLSEVAHEAFVQVDEFGTEAAAATAVVLLGGVPHGELELRVDRPFLFLIRDEETETVLFMGRVMDPRG